MLLIVLALVAAQAEPVTPEEPILSRRAHPRIRAAVGLLGGVILVRPAVPGLGIQGEAGVILDDRLSISGRASVFGNLTAIEAGLSAMIDNALSNQVTLGAGLALKFRPAFGIGFGSPLTLTVPLRVNWAPWARQPGEVERRGVLLGVELAGGVIIANLGGVAGTSQAELSPSFAALLTAGWAWW